MQEDPPEELPAEPSDARPGPDAAASDPPDPAERVPATARYAGGAGAGGRAGEHVVAAKNRWARAVLGFRDLAPETWYALDFTLAWDPAEEAGGALDFALVGLDFLAPDGSSLDLESVPGLVRTLPDPHGIWLPGPAYRPEGARAAALRVAFRVPAPASDLALGFRSWRNTAPFRVSGVRLRPVVTGPGGAPAPGARRRLGPEPLVLVQALVPGAGLVLRGQIFSERPDEHAAYAGLRYRDAAGAELPLPYPDTVSVPGHGASVNLPARPQARRFTLTLRPPPGAVTAELAFRTWEEADEDPPAVELVAAPEAALEERFRLESLCGDDLLDGPAFLARLAERLGLESGAEAGWMPGAGEAAADGQGSGEGSGEEGGEAAAAPVPPPLSASTPLPAPLARARALRQGPERTGRGPDGRPLLRLAGLPDWTPPDPPDWRADPFRSVPWRLDYQSLGWLAPLGAAAPALAAATAASWVGENPWGQPADPLSLHPAALSLRAEVLAGLAAGPLPAQDEAGLRPVLVGAAAQHGVALAEIVGQNAFGRSLHGVQAAAALLAVARALPRLPLAPFWDGLALRVLGEAVAALIGPDGRFAEPALQRRLDLLGLGRALAECLAGQAPGPDIAARVEAGLAGLPGLLDPGGRLPPFGDAPPAGDEAAWVARLLARGTDLAAARGQGPGATVSAGGFAHDTLSARADAVGRGAAHFACTFAAPQGHADCTSFVLAAEGVRWIVEAGGSESLEAGPARHYLVSARAHNVALLDGREPVAGPAWHAGRLRLEGATAHRIATRLHGPDVAHERIFVLLDDLDGIAVIDRFRGAAGAALAFEGLLHLAPEAIVALSGPRRALAQQGARRLNLVPWVAEGRAAGLTLVNGRSEPPGALQGFVAGPRGLVPAGTLAYAVAGRGTVCGGMLIATDLTVEERLTRLLAGEAARDFLAA